MLYTIKHGQDFTKTDKTYCQYLNIVNKETLLRIAKKYDIKLPKSYTKGKMAESLSAYVLSNPEKCLEKLSVKDIYHSKEPIEVRIDTEYLNAITIPGLPAPCVSKFSTEKEEMNYSYGVLTIEGHEKTGEPYIVSLI